MGIILIYILQPRDHFMTYTLLFLSLIYNQMRA